MIHKAFALILVPVLLAMSAASSLRGPGADSPQSAPVSLPTIIDMGNMPPDVDFVNPNWASVAGSGDFDGDGHADLLFAFRQPTVDTISGVGEFSILFGDASPASRGLTLESAPNVLTARFYPQSQYGFVSEVTSIPSLSGAGTSDIVLNSITVTGLLSFKERAIYVISGSSSLKPGTIAAADLPASLTVIPPVLGTDDYFSLEGAGDINGDGIMDLVFLTTPAVGKPATVSIVLGPFTAGQVVDLTQREPDVVIGPACLTSVTLADVNGDGVQDLLVGDGCDSQLDVVLGSPRLSGGLHLDLNAATADAVISGAQGLTRYTPGSVAVGDVNGDGIADILVTGSQKVCVVFGALSLRGRTIDIIRDQQDVTITGFPGNTTSGIQLAAYDIDGDNIADILVDDPFANGLVKSDRAAGMVYAVLGSHQLATGAAVDISRFEQDLTIVGPAPLSQLKLSPASFDYNLDGFQDIVLANSESSLLPSNRDISIIFGGPLKPPSIASATFKGNRRALTVSGANFTGLAQIEVNGTVIPQRADFSPIDGTLTIIGKRPTLNLRRGHNEIVVIRKGSRSNVFDLEL